MRVCFTFLGLTTALEYSNKVAHSKESDKVNLGKKREQNVRFMKQTVKIQPQLLYEFQYAVQKWFKSFQI